VLPNAVQPGTRLVDRYLLEEILGEAGGTAYWRAHDELLDRPVGVCLLRDEPDREQEILRAARLAAGVTDPRFLRVLDASESDGGVYVVNEWVKASNLADLLADGPLPAADAAALALEIADGLRTAHQEGLAHLCLQPENVLRTAHGQVKISGLGIDAAIRRIESIDAADAARRDTVGCAAVLYAALTARWPLDTPSRLVPAPREDGEVCSPRQVRAGIPHDLDEVVARGLGARLRDPTASLQTPDQLAQLLRASSTSTRAQAGPPPNDATQALRPGYPASGDDGPAYAPPYDDERRRGRGRLTKLAWGAVVLVLLVGIGLTGYQLATGAFDVAEPPKGKASVPADNAPKTKLEPISVADVTTLDPPPGGNGEENGDRAARVIDGDSTSEWNTKTYNDPFGPAGLKNGVGLVLDLGKQRDVRSVQLTLRGGGTDVELRAADAPGDGPDDYRLLVEAADQEGEAELRLEEPARTRYLLVWLTSLPAISASEYRGRVAEVVVRG